MSNSNQTNLTVLSVDDSVTVQELIKRALAQDYRVLLTSNAMDALSIISQETIDAVLLDLTLPEIDGLEFCRTVRRIPQFRGLPIIMLTSRDRPFDKVQGKLAGATEYLVKPFDADELRQVLKQAIKMHSDVGQ